MFTLKADKIINVGYKTVEPSSNLKNVIININKVDADNLFD